MAKQRVYVYKDEGFIDTYRVYPPVTILHKQDDIELVNYADAEARWEVRAGVLGDDPVDERVDPGKTKTKKAMKDGPLVAEYKVHVDGKRAHAQSDPVIIIDP